MKSDSTGPQRFGQLWPDGPEVGGLHRLTNTAVPRFDRTGCWQQHLLVFRAITKSNRWSADTAALQLFAHLDGEALQVALLMPDRIRERWKDFVDELSAYYNTPGRRGVRVTKFENAHRRPGLDPATFATELGILALRGFSDMKEKARDLMVRNKFIASQQSCDLRRHLDSAAPETSIGYIVVSCRIWESHAEPVAIDNWCQDPGYSQPTLLMPPPSTGSSSRLQYRVGNVMPAWNKSPRRVRHSSADRELLIRNVFEAVGARRIVRTVTEQRIRTATTGGGASGVSHKRKDIPSGESARRGNAPSNGRSGGPWPVFLLWIIWTWSEPMFTIRHIFPI